MKRSEKLLLVASRDAHAPITDLEKHFAILTLETQFDGSLVRRVFDRVGEQVG